MPHRKLIAEFVRRLGLTLGSAPPREGEVLAAFALAGLGRLTVEIAHDGQALILSLSLPLSPHDTEKLVAALALCHPARPSPFPLACGLARDTLALFCRQKIVGASAALLENQAIYLIDSARVLGLSA